MTDHDHTMEIIDYEVASELLTELMAVYRNESRNEKRKQNPDMELIETLDKKITEIWDQRELLGKEGYEPKMMSEKYSKILKEAEAERDKRQGPGNG